MSADSIEKDRGYRALFLQETLARADRLGVRVTGNDIRIEEADSCYVVKVDEGGSRSRGQLRKSFWSDYIDSDRRDGCGCVDAFFKKLFATLLDED
jgi:hypothetical protein